MHAKPGDATVGIDVESQVGEWRRALHGELVPRVALQRRPWEYLRPCGGRGDRLRVGRALDARSLDGARFGIVAAIEARIDDHTADDSGDSESQDTPVVAGGPPPTRFPTIHPLPALRVDALAPLGRC